MFYTIPLLRSYLSITYCFPSDIGNEILLTQWILTKAFKEIYPIFWQKLLSSGVWGKKLWNPRGKNTYENKCFDIPWMHIHRFNTKIACMRGIYTQGRSYGSLQEEKAYVKISYPHQVVCIYIYLKCLYVGIHEECHYYEELIPYLYTYYICKTQIYISIINPPPFFLLTILIFSGISTILPI